MAPCARLGQGLCLAYTDVTQHVYIHRTVNDQADTVQGTLSHSETSFSCSTQKLMYRGLCRDTVQNEQLKLVSGLGMTAPMGGACRGKTVVSGAISHMRYHKHCLVEYNR